MDEKLKKIRQILDAKQCEDIRIYDLRGSSAFTDYIIITSVNSSVQGKAVLNDFKKDLDFKPHHIEGEASCGWVLVDFTDYVVNIFLPETREFYALERIWGESQEIK